MAAANISELNDKGRRYAMGKVKAQCPGCYVTLGVNEKHIGKKARCPKCAHIFVLEELSNIKPSFRQESTVTRAYTSSQKTQTYQADATRTYQTNVTATYGNSPTTRTYNDNRHESTTRTTHNLAVHETIHLQGQTYYIEEIISQTTGEAVIYKVRSDADAVLALKLYFEFQDRRDEPNPEALSRIQQISDPDILRLHGFGTGEQRYDGKYCYEICDFAAGGNLLAKQHYTPQELMETVVPQIFKGITTLHRHKIYHCDLKPENIFWLDPERRDLVIGDYGSAKTREETSGKDVSYTSSTKGTDFYLAPEQPKGIISEKNDYYSFGMIVLRLLYPQFVTRECLRQILERQFSRKPIIDYDRQFQKLNDLIAGLTLVDVSARWGEQEVARWLKSEQVDVTYQHEAQVRPIKIGNATIRTPAELVRYIEQHTDWHEDLIEDREGYALLLQWIANIQDLKRKKVFDNMVKHYRQDGEAVLTEAVLRYFLPDRPVRVDMREYDIWNASDVEDAVTRVFRHIDDSAAATEIQYSRVHLFQLEFALRQSAATADRGGRMVAVSLLNKLEGALNLSPKATFDDYVCIAYPTLTQENLPVLTYAFEQQKSVKRIVGQLEQGLRESDNEFQKAEKSFIKINDEYQQNKAQMESLRQRKKRLEAVIEFYSMIETASPAFLVVAAYIFIPMLMMLLAWGMGEQAGVGEFILVIILWPLIIAIQGIKIVAGIADEGDFAFFALFIIVVFVPIGVVYFAAKIFEYASKVTQRQISSLQTRNRNIQDSLNQKQRVYDDLKQRRMALEAKLTHCQQEIRRVQAL